MSEAYRALLSTIDLKTLTPVAETPVDDKEEHPFTYCMQVVVPAIEEKNGPIGDANAFCGWWKSERAAEAPMKVARHVHLQGATGIIRTAMHDGREHIVVPVVALMEGVIHAINASTPELVTLECLACAPQGWDGRPIVLGHPVKDGRQISANSPGVLEAQGFGRVFGSHVSGKKLCLEAWIDPARAEAVGAGPMLAKIRNNEMVEVSVGAFVVTEDTGGMHGDKPYKAIWKDIVPDHLAFLPRGVGACSNAMGCGSPRMAMRLLEDRMEALGGPGSGNFGHGGRPGSVGGSSSGGSGWGTESGHEDATRRSHEGYGGTRTPVEGDQVRVHGNVGGQGKSGTVDYSNGDGTFHVVNFDRGGSGSYHSSDLKVRGEKASKSLPLKTDPDLTVVSIPGRDDADPASWFVMDRTSRTQIGGAHKSSDDASAALKDVQKNQKHPPVPSNRDEWRYQVKGSMGEGFKVVDTQDGDKVVSEHGDRLGANHTVANQNREYYTGSKTSKKKKTADQGSWESGGWGGGSFGPGFENLEGHMENRAAGGPGSGWHREDGHVPGAVAASKAGWQPGRGKTHIGFDSKDRMRIDDIITKADGNREKEEALAKQMAKSITGFAKASRRGHAAMDQNYHEIAKIFLDRAKELKPGKASTMEFRKGRDEGSSSTMEFRKGRDEGQGIKQYVGGKISQAEKLANYEKMHGTAALSKLMKRRSAGAAEDPAELLAYRNLRTLADQLSEAYTAVSDRIDTLLATETVNVATPEDEYIEDVIEDARLESVRTLSMSMYKKLNEINSMVNDLLAPNVVTGHASPSCLAAHYEDCEMCDGSGEKDGNPCPTCDGKGELKVAAGARHSAEDREMIQNLHDYSVNLGAACNVRAAEEQVTEEKVVATEEKVTEEKVVAEPVATEEVVATETPKETEPRAAAGVAAEEPCGCKGETMTSEQKAEAIAALVGNRHSGFTAGDEKMLEAASDERIEAFRVAAEARVQEVKAQELKAAAAATEVKTMTEDEFMKAAPESLRTLISRQQEQDITSKANLVAALKTAQSEYTESELSAKPLAELERLGRAVGLQREAKTTFEGRGIPRAAAAVDDKDDVFSNPPDPYAEGLKALRAANVNGSIQ